MSSVMARQAVAGKVPGSRAACHVAFLHEQMVGLLDGVARAAQIGRQAPDGGEARAGGVGAALDAFPHLGLQLAVEGGVAVLVQMHGASRL